MKGLSKSYRCHFLFFALSIFCAGASFAQTSRPAGPPRSSQRFQLAGHVHPLATAANDVGRLASDTQVSAVTVNFTPNPDQQASLDDLLLKQRTPGTAEFHQWLSPDEFANRFGLSASDLETVKTWFEAQGLTISGTARARTWISLSGTAAQMEQAFQTELHRYSVSGQAHISNSSAPSLPIEFNGIVRAVRGLNDFHARPMNRRPQPASSSPGATPLYTSAKGNHYIAPADLATIYNFAPLYNNGIDGKNQRLVIAGQTQINLSDIQHFRSEYGLAANDPVVTLVPGSRNPGISSDDIDEANLDLEWSGAVARNSSILYVYAYDVMNAVQYAIDQNMAPVISTSYGLCEGEVSSGEAATMRGWAQQANAQGITWFSASGDTGGADCAYIGSGALSVDIPGSIPEVTSVGGTEFQEGTGQYWAGQNSAVFGSATGYIPETSWNDSTIDGEPSASGGGASKFFSRPSWQNAAGVPGDTARHVPDVSMSASADHDGYLVYSQGSEYVYGGTSVPTPIYAGLAALLNQAQNSAGLGNANPRLYSLFQTNPAVFHDITSGDNIVTVTCSVRQRNCTAGTAGYPAAAGYDQVTGLGSVDAYALVTAWSGSAVTAAPTTTVTLQSSIPSLSSTQVVFITATVTTSDGSTPSGTVVFTAAGAQLGTANLVGAAGYATATISLTGAQLPQGTGTISASWGEGQTASLAVSLVARATSTAAPSLLGVTNAASFTQKFAPGELASVFGADLSPMTQSAGSLPLPLAISGVAVTVNGVAAPVWSVSPNQLNIQIPYEVAASSSATMVINNNGQVVSTTIPIDSAAPGVFTDLQGGLVPTGTAARGQTITLYMTGAGAVTPQIASGAAPAASTALSQLPTPQQATTVTVGGITAPVSFIGIPPGAAGVVQINFQIPASLAMGSQAVVVTVGSVASKPANLIVSP